MYRNSRLIVHESVKSPIAEAYRTLRTNLQFSKLDSELKMILFTSTGPGEGKSTTASNTAVALAQSGKKVVIIDCDLRKPVQHKIFQKSNQIGLTNILVGSMHLSDVIHKTEVPSVNLITSGPIPPNPSELLGFAKMNKLLEILKQEFDYVIIDAPPVLAVTDACVLASKVDGVVLVISSGMVRPEMARKAKELIKKASGHLLGLVMNKVEIEKENAYYYYYYGDEERKKERSS